MSDIPPLGFTTEVNFVRVIDGDTIEVEFKRRFTVRLTHPNKDKLFFNSPERKTPAGQEALDVAFRLFSSAKQVILHIPANKSIDLMDIDSLKRLVGRLWVDGVSFTQYMLDNCYAKLVRREDIGKDAN
jgi:endonuclease YncB( thermonuclease family)